MLRALAAIALIAVALAPAEAADARKPGPTAWDAYLAPSGRCGAAPVAAMACLIDWARVRRGLAPLRTVPVLDAVARAKLRAQIACGEFSHTPCGRSLVSFFRDAGYVRGPRWLVGENIALVAGGAATPRSVMRAWLYSRDHRANIFVSRFTEQGVAVVHEASFAGMENVTLWSSELGWRVDHHHDRQDARAHARGEARRRHAPRQRR